MTSTTRRFLIDAAERVAMTAAEAAIGVIIVSGTLDVSTGKQALTVGVITGLSAAKAIIAKAIGKPDSASVAPTV